jgi:hypothetical protein
MTPEVEPEPAFTVAPGSVQLPVTVLKPLPVSAYPDLWHARH